MSIKNPSKIVIWIQVNRTAPLIGEGILNQLALLVKEISKDGSKKIDILVPHYAHNKIENLLQNFGVILSENCRIVYVDKNSYQIKTKLENIATESPTNITTGLKNIIHKIRNLLSSHPKIFQIFHSLYVGFRDLLYRDIYKNMAKFIDASENSVCLVFLGTWHYANYIQKTPVVVFIPDIVFFEFPHLFSQYESRIAINKISNMANKAAAIITISEHVRQNHIIKHLNVDPGKIFVVKNPPITVNQYIEPYINSGNPENEKEIAAQLLNKHAQEATSDLKFVNDIALENQWLEEIKANNFLEGYKLLYYPTQLRPYKNIINLIKAVAILNEHEIQYKLLLTCTFGANSLDIIPNLETYKWLIVLPRLAPHLHAAAYTRADLTVAASLFEGSFPFLFNESLSVDTPVVMSHIPIVTDSLPKMLEDKMLFNPHEPQDIAQTIEKALSNQDELLILQKQLHHDMIKRNMNHVVQEMSEIFDSVGGSCSQTRRM